MSLNVHPRPRHFYFGLNSCKEVIAVKFCVLFTIASTNLSKFFFSDSVSWLH